MIRGRAVKRSLPCKMAKLRTNKFHIGIAEGPSGNGVAVVAMVSMWVPGAVPIFRLRHILSYPAKVPGLAGRKHNFENRRGEV